MIREKQAVGLSPPFFNVASRLSAILTGCPCPAFRDTARNRTDGFPPKSASRLQELSRLAAVALITDISVAPCAFGKRTIPRRRISMDLRRCWAEESYDHAALVSKTIGLTVPERSWKNVDGSGFSEDVYCSQKTYPKV